MEVMDTNLDNIDTVFLIDVLLGLALSVATEYEERTGLANKDYGYHIKTNRKRSSIILLLNGIQTEFSVQIVALSIHRASLCTR